VVVVVVVWVCAAACCPPPPPVPCGGIQISADQASIFFAQPMIVAGEGTSPLILLVLS